MSFSADSLCDLMFHVSVPSPPIIKIQTSSESFTVQWDPPAKPNGIIKSYKIVIQLQNISSDVPPRCWQNSSKPTEVTIDANADHQFTFNEAQPSATYLIQMFATNSEATSDPSDNLIQTRPGIYSSRFC
jgi:Fibronectin type III domain